MRRTTKGFFAGVNGETKRCKVFNSFIFRGKQKQIAFSPESYCSSRKCVINNACAFIKHSTWNHQQNTEDIHSGCFCVHLLFAVLLLLGILRHQIKSISTQLESEATTNITFMMIEFDLCGVSNLKNPFLLLLFISGWFRREFRLGYLQLAVGTV